MSELTLPDSARSNTVKQFDRRNRGNLECKYMLFWVQISMQMHNQVMNTYKRHRFPPDIISYAVWLYHRFNLSHRDIEDLLAERGIIVSYESIRLWCIKFGSKYARRLIQSHQGEPRKIVTDKLRSYGVAHREVIPEAIHVTDQYPVNSSPNFNLCSSSFN